MSDSFTTNLNLTKPEVGASADTWGTKEDANLDKIDAVFAADGSGTGVGLQASSGKTWWVRAGASLLSVAASLFIVDGSDNTKVVQFDASGITTGTTRTLAIPDQSGTIATQPYIRQWVPTGTIMSGYYGDSGVAGFLYLNGTTFGSALSGATQRANADCQSLYTALWTLGFTPTGGRGVSAAVDWTANKPMPLPDHRGCVMAALDTLGGTTSAAVLSAAIATSNTRGATGGHATTTSAVTGSTVVPNLTVSATGTATTGTESSDTVAITSGGGATIPSIHTHNVSMTVTGTATGQTVALTSGTTGSIVIAQPTIMVDVIIAL